MPIQQKNNQPTVMYSMSAVEKLQLANSLQKYHGVFKKFWQVSTIVFSYNVPTAAVYGKTSGEVSMMHINPDFWKSLTPIQQLWVICHECLHAILDHFSRGAGLSNHSLANKMMDIVINHTTIEKFGFKRSEIDPDNIYCWMDKFFKPEHNIPHGMNFEYYYNEIMTNPDKYENSGELLDEHIVMTGSEFDDLIKSMNKNMSDQEKQSIKDWLMSQMGTGAGMAGNTAGGMIWTFDIGKVVKKKKWESIIKKWVIKTVGMSEKPTEQWVFEDRRMALLPKTMSMPYSRDETSPLKKKDKINVFFFLDTSGSCIGFGERFFKAAKSIPTDKFNLYLFNFDTMVYDVDLDKGEVMGGGGTSFDIIEERIQSIIKEDGSKYPDAVWIITDGYGNAVKPEKPENWVWLMTEQHSTDYIHPLSKTYLLNDYE